MKKRLSVLLAAALFAALLLTGCPNKDKAPDASGEESSAAAVMTTAAAAGETDSAESTDSGEPTPSDTASADASSSVGGAEVSAENTSRQAAQTKAGHAAQTTAKPKPGQTAATKATQTTAKPLAALPLKTQWILKLSLDYETVIPTTDGKNWVGGRKNSGGKESFLFNTAGKVIMQADFMNCGTKQQFGDRIVACKDEKYALLSTDGKVILDFQNNRLTFYGEFCLKEKTYLEGDWVKIDRSGKEIGKYEGIVGYGAMKEDIYLFDQKNRIVYSATTIYDAQAPYHIVDFCKGPTICKSASKKYVALVGENIKDKSVEELIPSFLGYGAVINGELRSTTLYKELSLLKGFSDWRRDLYIAGTGTERFFTNTAGRAVLTEKFSDISANNNGTVAAVKQNGKWGFIRVPEL